MEPLAIDFNIVAKRRRGAPGDPAIMTQLNPGGAGDGRAPNLIAVGNCQASLRL
jgi:hypothetical protein